MESVVVINQTDEFKELAKKYEDRWNNTKYTKIFAQSRTEVDFDNDTVSIVTYAPFRIYKGQPQFIATYTHDFDSESGTLLWGYDNPAREDKHKKDLQTVMKFATESNIPELAKMTEREAVPVTLDEKFAYLLIAYGVTNADWTTMIRYDETRWLCINIHNLKEEDVEKYRVKNSKKSKRQLRKYGKQ